MYTTETIQLIQNLDEDNEKNQSQGEMSVRTANKQMVDKSDAHHSARDIYLVCKKVTCLRRKRKK